MDVDLKSLIILCSKNKEKGQGPNGTLSKAVHKRGTTSVHATERGRGSNFDVGWTSSFLRCGVCVRQRLGERENRQRKPTRHKIEQLNNLGFEDERRCLPDG